MVLRVLRLTTNGDATSRWLSVLHGWWVELGPMTLLMTTLALKYLIAGQVFRFPAEAWRMTEAFHTATLAAVLLLYSPLVLGRRAHRLAAAIVLNAALSALLIGDRIHFSFYGDLISVSELSYAWMLASVGGSIWQRIGLVEPLLFLDVLLAVALFRSYVRANADTPEAGWGFRAGWSAVFLLAGLVAATPSVRLVRRDSENVFTRRYARAQFVSVIGIVPYHLFDLATNLRTIWAQHQFSETQLEEVRRELNARHELQPARSSSFGVARGANVIIVQAESLQAFPVGLRVNGQSVTPNLDAFAAESLRFTNFHDQTWLGATSDAIFMSLQSLHPLGPGEGVISTRYLTNSYTGLPAVLADHGYVTLAAIGAAGRWWSLDVMFRKLGVQRLYLQDDFPGAERFGQGLADGDVFSQLPGILKRQREPFMAFVVSVSNHHPYDIPEKHRTLDVGALGDSIVGRYLTSVRYFDSAFGQLIVGLRKSGLLDRSVVVVYGDHEGFLEEPAELANLLGFSANSKYGYWKVRKKLPLFIRLPGARGAEVRTKAAGHLDLAPTLLSLLGISEPPLMLGSDMTAEGEGVVAFRDGSFATDTAYSVEPPQLGPRTFCIGIEFDQPVGCRALEAQRARALEGLRLSDLVIHGNLVPALGPEATRSTSRPDAP